jgi:hypothetical protein
MMKVIMSIEEGTVKETYKNFEYVKVRMLLAFTQILQTPRYIQKMP